MDLRRQAVVAIIAMAIAFYYTRKAFLSRREELPEQVESYFQEARGILRNFATRQVDMFCLEDEGDIEARMIYVLVRGGGPDIAPRVVATLSIEEKESSAEGTETQARTKRGADPLESKSDHRDRFQGLRERLRKAKKAHHSSMEGWQDAKKSEERLYSIVFHKFDQRLDEVEKILRPFLLDNFSPSKASPHVKASPRGSRFGGKRRKLQELVEERERIIHGKGTEAKPEGEKKSVESANYQKAKQHQEIQEQSQHRRSTKREDL